MSVVLCGSGYQDDNVALGKEAEMSFSDNISTFAPNLITLAGKAGLPPKALIESKPKAVLQRLEAHYSPSIRINLDKELVQHVQAEKDKINGLHDTFKGMLEAVKHVKELMSKVFLLKDEEKVLLNEFKNHSSSSKEGIFKGKLSLIEWMVCQANPSCSDQEKAFLLRYLKPIDFKSDEDEEKAFLIQCMSDQANPPFTNDQKALLMQLMCGRSPTSFSVDVKSFLIQRIINQANPPFTNEEKAFFVQWMHGENNLIFYSAEDRFILVQWQDEKRKFTENEQNFLLLWIKCQTQSPLQGDEKALINSIREDLAKLSSYSEEKKNALMQRLLGQVHPPYSENQQALIDLLKSPVKASYGDFKPEFEGFREKFRKLSADVVEIIKYFEILKAAVQKRIDLDRSKFLSQETQSIILNTFAARYSLDPSIVKRNQAEFHKTTDELSLLLASLEEDLAAIDDTMWYFKYILSFCCYCSAYPTLSPDGFGVEKYFWYCYKRGYYKYAEAEHLSFNGKGFVMEIDKGSSVDSNHEDFAVNEFVEI
jgi:hypothetical protein